MSKPLIIIFSTSYHPFVGGAEIAAAEIAKRLTPDAIFHVITARQKRELAKYEEVGAVAVRRVGFGNIFDKVLLPVLGVVALIRIVRARARDQQVMLFGLDVSQGALAAVCAKLWYPRFSFILNIQYGEDAKRLSCGLRGVAFRLMLAYADHVTAISNYLGNVAREYGYCGPLSIIPNGVDTKKFLCPTDITRDSHTIITVSRLVRKNGIDLLLRAIAAVALHNPGVRCEIIGEGLERVSLEELSRALGIQDRVVFHGAIAHEELMPYLCRAAVFVRPSRSEGMGNAFVEALAAGVPVIGTSVGGIPDIIIDGETGLLTIPDDADALAVKIAAFLADRARATALADAGRARVYTHFSWDKIAAAYGTLFSLSLKVQKRMLIATGMFPPDIGGPATYTKFLTDELPLRGIGVRVVSFGGVRHQPPLLRHIVYMWRVAMRSRGCDIIYAQDPVSVGVPAALAAILTRKTLVIKMVGDYAWEQGVQRFDVKETLDDFLQKTYGRRVEFLRRAEIMVAKMARRVIVPSEYLKTVVTRWGISPERIRVIHNAFEPIGSVVSKEDARNFLGLKGMVMVSAGRLVPWKGFQFLIEIISEMREEVSDISLIIIGSGPDYDALKEYAHRMGMRERVLFTGAISQAELGHYLAASDCFVLHTAYEGFSHVILEAMAAHTLVVTTRVGGNTEVVTDKKDGFLVAHGDKEGFKNAIRTALAMSADERREFIHAADAKLFSFRTSIVIQKLVDELYLL